MRTGIFKIGLGLIVCMAWGAALAQPRPYIGYAFPAGGQQGTTFQVKLGGQNLDGVDAVQVTGSGVSARVVDYLRRLNNQEMQLLNEQLRDLRRTSRLAGNKENNDPPPMMMDMMSDTTGTAQTARPAGESLLDKIEKRTRDYVQNPACASIAAIVHIEVAVAADAEPGDRELRLVTSRGVSNPLVFQVGQVPEATRPAMRTAPQQVLGKENLALRQRPTNEIEVSITLPCVMNGQIASGEVNRYRFSARQAQHLVLATSARHLIPFIADAVPGWFQPVVTLYDSSGQEVAFADDFRFCPDPVLHFQVPRDGEYVLEIRDSLYRGREDFVYRITAGELPYITGIYPLGARAGQPVEVQLKGWNLDQASLSLPATDRGPGVYQVFASAGKHVSNPVPFVWDVLPEALEKEPNNTVAKAQKVTLPANINGRIGAPGDVDVFAVAAEAGDTLVAEVTGRRLNSPVDTFVKVTDAAGTVLAFNDDTEDLSNGINTHHADSSVTVTLPARATYYVQVSDTARQGGEDYAYRLRLSQPAPDFSLRAVPASLSLRGKTTGTVTVNVLRKDGFAGPIKLDLDPIEGFTATPVTVSPTQTVARLTVRSLLAETREPVILTILGKAQVNGQELVRTAVPAEDRMQAFLWRHWVPSSGLSTVVFDPATDATPRRMRRRLPPVPTPTNAPAVAAVSGSAKPKFTQQQIAGRLRQLKVLYEEGLLTDRFYKEKVEECYAVQ